MDERVLNFLISRDKDSCRFLLCSLEHMLRTGNPGVLCHPKVREILAGRLNEAIAARAEDVSDALGITRGRSDASPYGSCKYEFIIWYYSFLDAGTKPTGIEQEKWLDDYPGDSPSTGSTVNDWVREAKDSYLLVLQGAKQIVSVT